MSKKETAETTAQTTNNETPAQYDGDGDCKLSRYYNIKDVTSRREIREDILGDKQYVFYAETTTNADSDGNKELTLEIGVEKIDGGVIEKQQSIIVKPETLNDIITMLQIIKQTIKNFKNSK